MPDPAPDYQLTGQVAVVTGSSTGIGRAIALELAAAGAAVLVHARSSLSAAEEVAQHIRRRGAESHVVLADVSTPEGRQKLLDEAYGWKAEIHVWINNAGADVLTGAAAKWSFEHKLDVLWQTDVRGTIVLAREVGARMRPSGQAPRSIVNIGWDQAEHGMAGDSGEMFAATKGAIMAFTRSLAHSLAPDVRVNCLALGWIRTEWGQGASDKWQQRARQECLLDRWGTPEDVARVVRFLVSPAGSFLSGQVIPVNGGFRHGASVGNEWS